MKPAFTLISPQSKQPNFFEEDYWQAESVGFKPDGVHSAYHLKFNQLKPSWFKQAVKQFVLFQSATKSFGTCRSYIIGLTHFGGFIATLYPQLLPHEVNRQLITHFFQYLKQRGLSANTRQLAIIHLRTFHQLAIQEDWLPWPIMPLIYNSDLPKPNDCLPRYIPETVVTQLKTNLSDLPLFYRHLIIILLETGRRISEICPLPFDCLEQDQDGDYFMKVKDRKLKKSYLIPISPACIEAIKTQQALVKTGTYHNQIYLFPTKTAVKSPHVGARYLNKRLNQLAREQNIVDTNGKLWHFHAHQFRHTVGTRMINAGIPQAIVQKYLGHESPQMTARYAHIHQETLKAAFYRYQETVNIQGILYYNQSSQQVKEAKWLKHTIMAQALPNGLCALPAQQSKCPHANACLTCAHFRTTREFLSIHREQLVKTEKIIEEAKKQGWHRQAEMNLTVKNNLENIIKTLEKTA
jgi:integrase